MAKYAGAVILAMHHPPFSYAAPKKSGGAMGNHGGSPAMLREIDAICKSTGVYPHAFLSGHAHNYQRFARSIRFGGHQYEVPFIVCGDGGHNVNPLVRGKAGVPVQEPHFGADVSYLENKPALTSTGLILKHYDDTNYGYLRITVDKRSLQIGFHMVNSNSLSQSRIDMVTVDLKSHTVTGN